MRLRALTILLLVSASVTDAQGTRDPLEISVVDSACVPGRCTCRGDIAAHGELAAHGVDRESLRAGETCLVADFDGNGRADFVLTGGEGFYAVVLRQSDSTLVTQFLDAAGLIELYAPRAEVGPHGEPVARTHGLFVRDVGRFHVVWLWTDRQFVPHRLPKWEILPPMPPHGAW